MSKITQEEFEAWRVNPVTEKMFAWLKELSSTADTFWMKCLDDPRISAEKLHEFKTEVGSKKQICQDIVEVKLEDIQSEDNDAGNVIAINS